MQCREPFLTGLRTACTTCWRLLMVSVLLLSAEQCAIVTAAVSSWGSSLPRIDVGLASSSLGLLICWKVLLLLWAVLLPKGCRCEL